MSKVWHWLGALALGVFMACFALAKDSTKDSKSTPEPTLTPAKIEEVWQKRQNMVRTFKYTWDEKFTIAKGAFFDGQVSDRKNPGGKIVPPESVTHDTSFVLTMDGAKSRFFYDQVWMSANQELIHQPGTTITTADGYKRFLEPGTTHYPRGVISPENADRTDVNDPTLLPLLSTFRSNHTLIDRFKDFARQFELLPGRVTVEDRECVQLKQIAIAPAQTLTTIWLDPQREYVIVRMTRSRDGKLFSQVSFHEFRQTEFGWVPIRWTTTMLNDAGAVDTTQAAIVREFELNKPVDSAQFDLTFPTGTWVTDIREPQSQYILKASGEKRIILEDELINQATYEQLLTTNTGEGLRKTSRKSRAISIGTTTLLIAIVFIGYWVHRRRRRPEPAMNLNADG